MLANAVIANGLVTSAPSELFGISDSVATHTALVTAAPTKPFRHCTEKSGGIDEVVRLLLVWE